MAATNDPESPEKVYQKVGKEEKQNTLNFYEGDSALIGEDS